MDLSDFCIILFALLFPFSVKIALIFLIFHFIFSIRSNFQKNSFQIENLKGIIAASILFYLLHVFSLLISTNISNGYKDLETKFSLLILPLIILFFPRTQSQSEIFIRSLVYSMALAAVVCFICSGVSYFKSQDSSEFFYDKFSILMHPTYFTMYLGLALLFAVWLARIGDDKLFNNYKFIYYLLLVVLLSAVFMASSRAGILIVLLCLILFYSRKQIINQIAAKSDVVIFGVVSCIFAIIMIGSNSRFQILYHELAGTPVIKNITGGNQVDENPLEHRLTLMKVAVNVALRNPFGVGNGDVQDVLVSEYKKIGYEKAVMVRYNPHNQYLQTAVATGIPGLLALLWMFFMLFKNGNYFGRERLAFYLGVLIVCNALFESVLEVQRGVLFFAVALVFLYPRDLIHSMGSNTK